MLLLTHLLLVLTLPSSLLAIPLSHQTSPSPLSLYASHYGTIFIWHAALAVLAWALVAPLGHVLSHFARLRGFSEVALARHRVFMLLTLVLTFVVFALGILFAKGVVPNTHRILGIVVILLTSLQALLGALRPCKSDEWRALWMKMHRAVGVSLLFFGGYVVHHSFDMFDVEGGIKLAVDGVLAFMMLGFITAHLIGFWVGNSVETAREEREQLLGVEEQVERPILEEHDMFIEGQ